MSTSSRAALAIVALASAFASYQAFGSSITPQIGGGIGSGFDGGISGKAFVLGPQPTGDILMVDAVSLILQTDGTSFVCRAGGC